MKVLFMVDSLVTMGDDELYVINSANMLKNYLYDVTIYTNAISKDLKFLLHGIRIITGLSERNDKRIIKEEFNIIHSFLGENTLAVNNIAIKSNSQLFIIVSENSKFEMNANLAYVDTATNIIFTSLYAREKHPYVQDDKAVVIYDPIDVNQFRLKDKKNIDKDVTFKFKHSATIVIYGQIIADQLLGVFQELSYLVKGLNVIVLGKSDNKSTYNIQSEYLEYLTITNVGEVVNPQDYINFADLVIANKREAIESIYCEKLVYVIDKYGVKGIVNMQNAHDYLFTIKGQRIIDSKEFLDELYNGLTINYQSEYKKLRNYLREISKEKILKDLY